MMVAEVVDSEVFCETIHKHIWAAHPFNNNFIVSYQFAYIVMLNIDVFYTRLAFCILGEDNVCLIVAM